MRCSSSRAARFYGFPQGLSLGLRVSELAPQGELATESTEEVHFCEQREVVLCFQPTPGWLVFLLVRFSLLSIPLPFPLYRFPPFTIFLLILLFTSYLYRGKV